MSDRSVLTDWPVTAVMNTLAVPPACNCARVSAGRSISTMQRGGKQVRKGPRISDLEQFCDFHERLLES